MQDIHYRGLPPVHALAEGLNDKAISVAVDDKRGKQVTFGSDHSISLRSRRHLLAESGGGANSLREEGSIARLVAARQKAQRNLRLLAVKGLPPKALLLVDQADYAGFNCRRGHYVGSVNPGMSGGKPLNTSLRDGD